MRRSWVRAAGALLGLVLFAACGAGSSSPAAQPVAPTEPEPSSPTAVAPTTVTTGARAGATTSPPEPRLAQAGQAGQVVVVTAPGYGATSATLTA